MPQRILLVDDEPLVTEELQEALEFEGHAVEAVGSVPDALAACERQNFDLIITDLKMPHLGGMDLLRILLELPQSPKVFVLSGHGAESNRTEAMELGAAECFSKPIDPDILAERISCLFN